MGLGLNILDGLPCGKNREERGNVETNLKHDVMPSIPPLHRPP